jgi:hypothetical protein
MGIQSSNNSGMLLQACSPEIGKLLEGMELIACVLLTSILSNYYLDERISYQLTEQASPHCVVNVVESLEKIYLRTYRDYHTHRWTRVTMWMDFSYGHPVRGTAIKFI